MSELTPLTSLAKQIVPKGFTYIWNLTEKKVLDSIKKKKWRELFSTSGDNIIRYMDKEGGFTEELTAIFSKENMYKIAKRMENENGFNFSEVLHDELHSLLQKYEADENSIETYTHFFSEQIINFIRENDSEKSLEIYLGAWKVDSEKQHEEIKRSINDLYKEVKKINSDIESIEDIEKALKEKAYYNINLDFFELDDETFKVKFDNAVRQKQEMLLIEGKSKEETLYRVLNEIKQTFPEINALIIYDRTSWENLAKSGITGTVLIPFFNFEDLTPIPENICIYIYNEETICRSNKKIVLRKRTKRNLEESLANAGMSHNEAYHLVENTHGLYASLKHRLFKIPPSTHVPQWVNDCSDIVLTALLLGEWRETEGDQEAFKALSGSKYEKCLQSLKQYDHSENPLIVRTETFGGYYYQIASIEDSWALLRPFISDEFWNRFLDLALIILCRHEPIKNNQYGYRDSMYSDLTSKNYSKTILKGIIRTFILGGCFDEDRRRQCQIDYTVSVVLDTIINRDDWDSIASYLPDLCEAAPNSVLKRLEKELVNSTGMMDLFYEQSNYVDILWATELLVQQNEYRLRAINWLWEINNRNIKYERGNTPQDILERVFCAWINLTELSSDDKIQEAKKAITKYRNAWDVIVACLPNGSRSITTPLYNPRFRNVDEPKAAYVSDAYNVFYNYLKICVNAAGTDTDRWVTIIKALPSFNAVIQREIFSVLLETTNSMDDAGKTIIKQKLQDVIYHHRRFEHSDWAMQAESIQLFEDAYNSIIVDDPVYDYLYLFLHLHSFPLFHPVPYNREENGRSQFDDEERLIDEEITLKIKEFKGKGLSIKRLIELSSSILKSSDSRIGYVIAHYYDHDEFNDNSFDALLRFYGNNIYQMHQYARMVVKDSLPQLKMIISKIKAFGGSNALIARIISLQIVKDTTDCIIFHESDEVKKEFWKESPSLCVSQDTNPEVIQEALNQCLTYGTLESYVEILFNEMKNLSIDDLYRRALDIEKIQDKRNSSMSEWYIEKILERLQDQYLEDDDKSYHIARLEWFFGDLIHWDQMKCLRRWLEKDPRIYAYLVDIVCRKDNQEKPDPVKQERASKLYGKFKEIRFCPAETNGIVEYDELKKWVDDFKSLLQNQDQFSIYELILGELFSNSPVDEDGYMPCRAVCQIIEEHHDESLGRAYENEVINQRGIYSPNAGKGETILANRYQTNADKLLQAGYPHTAQIYRNISNYFLRMASQERKEAEDAW